MSAYFNYEVLSTKLYVFCALFTCAHQFMSATLVRWSPLTAIFKEIVTGWIKAVYILFWDISIDIKGVPQNWDAWCTPRNNVFKSATPSLTELKTSQYFFFFFKVIFEITHCLSAFFHMFYEANHSNSQQFSILNYHLP